MADHDMRQARSDDGTPARRIRVPAGSVGVAFVALVACLVAGAILAGRQRAEAVDAPRPNAGVPVRAFYAGPATSTAKPASQTGQPVAPQLPDVQDAFSSPHSGFTLATSTCALCHRAHTAVGSNVTTTTTQSALCFSCHDGTGANSNVQSAYTDPSVPANSPATSSFYSHLPSVTNEHTSGQEDEFAGALNRHAECGDCHNPHTLDSSKSAKTSSGWTASGALTGSAGVSASPAYAYKNPVSMEAEVCFKCHSASTVLLSYSKESYKKTDKIYEFDPANASYHPVEAPGKNVGPQMATSLAGGTRWRFTTADTVRCVNCHGDPRIANPSADARLGTHTSPYRGMLIANYRDRTLKSSGEAYNANDFALCYLCHGSAPFTDKSGDPRPDSRFSFHGVHTFEIGGGGLASTDIDTAGAGQGKAICAECHYRIHSTSLAPWTANRTYSSGVNFAPNVQPISGQVAPLWSRSGGGGNCTLRCHGKNHSPKNY
ncbi:MAG: hypothetical protein EPO22_02645 [Dehalococcoidia bacterium]|nr:MAG: hypothetical protein EPO22_02645 [Dehalococcoidia bacterium]